MRRLAACAAALGLLALSPVGMGGPLAERWADGWAEDGDEDAASAPAGVRVVRDIAYGQDARQRFDVYLPAAPEKDVPMKGAPVFLMVHGGAWRTGDKARRPVVDNKVARWVAQGVVFVSTNYRLLPAAAPLEQARDVARALATVQQHAAEWGGDPARVVLLGHSAGAHLAALLAAAPTLAAEAGARPWLGTVAIDSAAFDVPRIMAQRHYGFYDHAFGADPADWRTASPMHRLAGLRPPAAPLLAICSTRRADAPCVQARAFAATAARHGLRVRVLEQAASHRALNDTLGRPGAYTTAVEDFLASLGIALRR